MSVVGFQDFWVAGIRVYVKRDAVEGVPQPEIDLGVIQSSTPTLTPTKLELIDSDGGVRRTVDETVSQIAESYDVVCSNFNRGNLALLFLSTAPAEFTQVATHKRVTTYLHAGHLCKIVDSDADATALYKLGAIAGVISAVPDNAGVLSTSVLTTIVKSTKTLTISTGASSDFDAGDKIVVEGTGLANILNARTYTVVSASGSGPVAIVVSEEPAADETAITGSLIYKKDADSGTVYGQDTDWEVVSLDRGYLRVISGGAIAADGNKVVVFSTAALSGKRLLNPQSSSGEIKGTCRLVWSRNNNRDQDVRECQVSITPNGMNLSSEDYSNMTLTIKVISDPTADIPAGRLLQFTGTLPTTS